MKLVRKPLMDISIMQNRLQINNKIRYTDNINIMPNSMYVPGTLYFQRNIKNII